MAYAAALVDLGREQQGRRPDRKLILRTLEILFESQLDDGLWSKGNPIFHYEGLGSVYPFAFETLAAVMHMAFRVASSTNDPAWTQFLHPYLPSLLRTLTWAESHELQGDHSTGWRSNHVLPGNQPHAWATAMVLSFVRALDAVLQRLTSEHVLSGFAARYLGKVDGLELEADNWTRLWDSDVTRENGERSTLKRVLFSSVITPHLNRADPRVWNMVLSGPPGTAKTALSEEIARALGWPLITMGTGDFLAEGADRMAGEARRLFRRLELLSDAIVLIDEVDEFVRERNQEKNDRESRLITTAMLTLLQGLKERKRVLLILATNSKDFDPAIIRSGRMDLLLYVLPPSFESKRIALVDLLGEGTPGRRAEFADAMREPASRIAIERFTYLEWNEFLRSLSSSASSLTGERLVALIAERARSLALTDEEWTDWKGRRSEVHV